MRNVCKLKRKLKKKLKKIKNKKKVSYVFVRQRLLQMHTRPAVPPRTEMYDTKPI